jgi:hypothetical protein
MENHTNSRVIYLKGRILPEIRNVSLLGKRVFHVDDPTGAKGIFHFEFKDGIVDVKCEIEKSIPNLGATCIAKALELGSIPINILAFSKGWHLTIIFDEMTEAEIRTATAFSELSLQECVTAFSSAKNFESVEEILADSFNIRFAFSDLISSLGNLNYSAIASGRAVEAVRRDLSPQALSEKQAWKNMREKLNIDEEYLRIVTNASTKPRHGDRGATNGQIQMKVTRSAWQIMNRYLEYKIRGGIEKLSENDFPFLR